MAVDLNRLIELAYSSAVEDDLWRLWTEELVEQFESPGALFWVIDADRFDMCHSRMLFRDADNSAVNEEYLSGPVKDDPQMRRVCDAKKSEIYLDTDHVDLDDPRTLEYLKWQEAAVGTRHHITLSVVLRPGLEAGVSMHRTARQGPANPQLQKQMAAVFPHLSHALRLGFQHADALQRSWWDGLLENERAARILLDEDGVVLCASPAAEQVLRREDGLIMQADRLTCHDPACAASLAAAISGSCAEVAAQASGVVVARRSGGVPYLVQVYPLVQRRRYLAPFGAASLICIRDPSGPKSRLPGHVAEMLSLTPKEADLANLLLSGHSLASLSCVLEISLNTARNHLQSIMRKTGTSRQSELVLFLADLV